MPFQFMYLSSSYKQAHSIACVELNIVKISKPSRKGHRIKPIRKLYVRLIVLAFLAALRFLKHKIPGLKPPATSLIFTLDFWPGTKSIQPVTSQGCFDRAKMAANFLPKPPTSSGLKRSFCKPLAKKVDSTC